MSSTVSAQAAPRTARATGGSVYRPADRSGDVPLPADPDPRAEPPAPTPAATVLLLRDAPVPDGTDDGSDARAGSGGPAGTRLEVLLLERSLNSDFVGGALVFPGGKVDPLDGTLDPARWQGPDPATELASLGVADGTQALGLRVAAVRETFEEAGVLLARHEDGAPVTAAELATVDAVEARAALIDRGPVADWFAWLERRQLVLDLDALALWSWWVTPEGIHRRFDTRFFVAALPAEQADVAAHDEVEITDVLWSTPAAALAAHAAGEAMVIFPTRCNLTDLDAHPSAAAAVAAARDGRCDTSRILPRTLRIDGVMVVQHPDGRPPEPI